MTRYQMSIKRNIELVAVKKNDDDTMRVILRKPSGEIFSVYYIAKKEQI